MVKKQINHAVKMIVKEIIVGGGGVKKRPPLEFFLSFQGGVSFFVEGLNPPPPILPCDVVLFALQVEPSCFTICNLQSEIHA